MAAATHSVGNGHGMLCSSSLSTTITGLHRVYPEYSTWKLFLKCNPYS